MLKWPTRCPITLYKNVQYYNPVYVSSNTVLIIRISNCINTASGVVLSVSDCPLCTLDDQLQSGKLLYQMLYLYNSPSWWWAQCCSKHIQDYYNNKPFALPNCAPSRSFTQSCTRMHGQQNIETSGNFHMQYLSVQIKHSWTSKSTATVPPGTRQPEDTCLPRCYITWTDKCASPKSSSWHCDAGAINIEDGSGTSLRNLNNYLPVDTVSHFRALGPSSTEVW